MHSALSHLCKFSVIGDASNTNLLSHRTIQTTLLDATKFLVAAITLAQVARDWAETVREWEKTVEECTYRSHPEIWLFKPQSSGLSKDTTSSALADSPKIDVFDTKGRSTSILDGPFWTWGGGVFEEGSVILEADASTGVESENFLAKCLSYSFSALYCARAVRAQSLNGG